MNYFKRNWPIIGVSITIIFLLFQLFRIPNRLMVSVGGFEIANTNTVSVGRNSDFCYNKLPEDYLSVTYQNDSATVQINKDYADSLFYYKINNVNPNAHRITSDANVEVQYEGDTFILNKTTIDSLVGEAENKYIAVRWLWAKSIMMNNQDDSVWARKIASDSKIKSIIVRDEKGNDDPLLVILDNYTTLGGTGYAWTRHVAGDKVKLQFFEMVFNSYSTNKSTEHFEFDGKRYIAKPVIVCTEWGAGHVLFEYADTCTKVFFQKPLTFIENLDTLKTIAKSCSGMLTIRQNDHSFPAMSTILVPQISSRLNPDICNIQVDSSGFKCDETLLSTTNPTWLIPAIPHVYTKINPGAISRMGVMNKFFYVKFLIWPLIFCVFFFFVFRGVTNANNVETKGKTKENRTLTKNAKSLKDYAVLVFLVAFAYFICRILIAVKLSYTYPYFEEIGAIVIPTCCLMALSIVQIALLINRNYLLNSKNKLIWTVYTPILLGIIVTAGLFYGAGDCFIKDVLNSYLDSERFHKNWMEDLHRNVPIDLFAVNVILFLVLCFVRWWNAPINKLFNKLFSSLGDHINVNKKIANSKNPTINKVAWMAILLLIGIVIGIVIGLPLSHVGNIGSSIFTILFVPFVSWYVCAIEYKEKTIWFPIILLMVILVASFVTIGENGYYATLMGVVAFLLVLVIFSGRKGESSMQKDRIQGYVKVDAIVSFVLVVVAMIFFFWVYPKKIDPNVVTNDRMEKRFSEFAMADRYAATGYRYAQGDEEFMMVLSHSMLNSSWSDPLSANHHPLHPLVSRGQTPVVLNDVSAPAAFFGSYGGIWLLIIFLIFIACFASGVHRSSENSWMDQHSVHRLLASCMWFSATLLLIASYFRIVPYTGRLIPGLGVDALGEALECSALLAFMLSTQLFEEK